MYTAACSILRSRLVAPVVALLLTTTLSTHLATAQTDPGMQAAQQASQQAAQQASQQAMQAAQQASQNAQAAAMEDTPAYSSSSRPQQQQPTMPPLNTPVPAQVRFAHTIFLANDGADPNFPIDPDTAYAAFSSAIRAWGHYQIAANAQQADLVFQLHGVAPITDISGGRGGVYSTTSPAFQLTIRDPRTNTRLWTVTSPFLVPPRRSKLGYWQNISIANLVSRVKVLAGEPLSSSETADLTTYPNYHYSRNAAILVGAGVGIAAGGAILLHHAYENSLSSQKASQDAFCTANNIPLSECAGG